MVEVANSTSTVLTAGQTIPFVVNTFDTNDKIHFEQSTNSIVITKVGKYEVNGSFVFAPTDAGVATITAYANGVQIPFDIASVTSGATAVHTFTLPQKIINVVQSSSGNVVRITFVTSVGGTLTNAVASVKYIE